MQDFKLVHPFSNLVRFCCMYEWFWTSDMIQAAYTGQDTLRTLQNPEPFTIASSRRHHRRYLHDGSSIITGFRILIEWPTWIWRFCWCHQTSLPHMSHSLTIFSPVVEWLEIWILFTMSYVITRTRARMQLARSWCTAGSHLQDNSTRCAWSNSYLSSFFRGKNPTGPGTPLFKKLRSKHQSQEEVPH